MLGEGSFAQVFQVDVRQEKKPGCVSIQSIVMSSCICVTTRIVKN